MIKKIFKSKLAKNTFFLYLLLVSNYLLNFITIPYQTRILGPELFGKVGFSMAFMIYFSLIIDYGFILSATEEVAKKSHDNIEISKIFTSVTIIKLVLFFLSLIIIIAMVIFIDFFKGDALLYILTFLAVSSGSLLPDFVYRGVEKMKLISIRTVTIRSLYVLLVFTFLKSSNLYLLIPFFLLIVNVAANFYAYYHLKTAMNIKLCKIDLIHIKNTFIKSTRFFLSRLASTIYSATNTVFLGFVYPDQSPFVGFYVTADKIISTGKAGISPLADSLYPYMIINKNYNLIKRLLIVVMPFIIVGVALGMYFSVELSIFIFGQKYEGSGLILRYLLPILAMTPLTYILGFPVLGPMGLSRHANYSVIIAATFHLASLFIIHFTTGIDVLNIAILTCISEFILLLYRLIIILKNRKILRLSNEKNLEKN